MRDYAGLHVDQDKASRLLRLFYPSRYTQWIQQFEGRERVLAERLFGALSRYTEKDLLQMSENCLRKLCELDAGALQTARLVGLGHAGKSGNHALYFFHHAVKKLDTAIETSNLFKWPPLEPLPAGSSVIFVDDFIGSGTQAQKYFTRLLSKEEGIPWLRECKLYYLAWVGLRDGVKAFEEWVQNKLRAHPTVVVLPSTIVEENEKPFSPTCPIFPFEKDRKEAEKMVRKIGIQILPDEDEYNVWRDKDGKPDRRVAKSAARARHALGWRGSQGLIVFPYNTPNNTLPIFWGRGLYRGMPWTSLFPRLE